MVGRTNTRRCARCGLGLGLWLLSGSVGGETLPTLELLEFLGSGDERLVSDLPAAQPTDSTQQFVPRYPADAPPRLRPEFDDRPRRW